MSAMKLFAAAATVAAIAISSNASAATVTFGPTDWLDQGNNSVGADFLVTISDISGGVSFDLSLAPGSVDTGDVLYIGFEGVGSIPVGSFSNLSTNTGDGITDVCYDTTKCGSAQGFQGGFFNSFTFDTIVQIGDQGSSSGLNTDVSFDIAGVTAADFLLLGLRVQSVGSAPNGGDGSLKIYSEPSAIPLPAPALLLFGALGGLGYVGRRRKLT